VSPIKLPHCAVLARQLGERPTGTASRFTSLLLIEHAGPWSEDVRERVLTRAFGEGAPERLDELHVRLGLRAVVIRRHGRHRAVQRPTVFVSGCRPGRRWLERLTVDDYPDLAGLDLVEVAEGAGGLGEPVADALAAEFPDQTWQCTHFGGDRWAGNLLVAPNGFMYGQLDATSAVPAARAALRGEVELANLRGRIGADPFAQVAEIAVREHTGLRGTDDVLAGAVSGTEEQASVEVEAAGVRYRVVVRRRPMGVHGHSICSGEAHPHRFDVLDLRTAIPA
jgi:hypothetical protein